MADYRDLAVRVRDQVHEEIVEPEFNGYTNARVTTVETQDQTVLIHIHLAITIYTDKGETVPHG